MPDVKFTAELTSQFPALQDLCEGRLNDLAAQAMALIAENIQDEGTNPVTPRSFTVKVAFVPDMLRKTVEVKAEVAYPKLAPQLPVTSTVVLGGQGEMVEQGGLM